MLRGMYVDPAQQRQGVGSHLLRAFVRDLAGVECFCLPFAHLIAFYERGGFAVVAEDTALPFLAERLSRYRQEGRDVLIMRRPIGVSDFAPE
jgi:GNAT superfamily N-acetyltransferase